MVPGIRLITKDYFPKRKDTEIRSDIHGGKEPMNRIGVGELRYRKLAREVCSSSAQGGRGSLTHKKGAGWRGEVPMQPLPQGEYLLPVGNSQWKVD